MAERTPVGKAWMRREQKPPLELHTDRPHAARVYDVLLGGKTNYAADRAAAAVLEQAMPIARRTATANRTFMHRAVEFLAAEHGIRQFIDIGTGIPTQPNLHETAQAVHPDARVVYADNDPIVLAHSRALHEGTPEGRTAYVHGDLREPGSILCDPEAVDTLDYTRPVAITLLTVLHWLPDSADPHAIVRRLLDRVPSGSWLVVSHITTDQDTSVGAASEGLNAHGNNTTPRSRDRVLSFFDGLDLADPGLVLVERWRPAADGLTTLPVAADGECAAQLTDPVPLYVGVARKP